MGPIWGRQDPGGLHIVPMNFAIWATATAVIVIMFSEVSPRVLTSEVSFILKDMSRIVNFDN